MVERLLVPIDESEQSMDALAYALDTFPDAEVTMLHVVDPGELAYLSTGGEMGESVDDARAELERDAEELLDDARAVAAERGAEVSAATRTGKVSREIVDYAAENDVDHVAIGSHGRTGASRVLLGSNAEEVVRRAPVPVTVV